MKAAAGAFPPRRNGLAEEVADAVSCRIAWPGHRQHSVPRENMLGRTFCPLGDAAAMPRWLCEKFRKEFEDHLNGKPCPFANMLNWP